MKTVVFSFKQGPPPASQVSADAARPWAGSSSAQSSIKRCGVCMARDCDMRARGCGESRARLASGGIHLLLIHVIAAACGINHSTPVLQDRHVQVVACLEAHLMQRLARVLTPAPLRLAQHLPHCTHGWPPTPVRIHQAEAQPGTQPVTSGRHRLEGARVKKTPEMGL
jgi:hypothetical protein